MGMQQKFLILLWTCLEKSCASSPSFSGSTIFRSSITFAPSDFADTAWSITKEEHRSAGG